MLPPAHVILEAAQRGDWHEALGICPGTELTPKQERALRAQVHPDRGHCHNVAAAVGQALESLRKERASSVPSDGFYVDRLIERCSQAVQCESLNAAGAALVRRILDDLILSHLTASPSRLRYYYKGWGEQADNRCYNEIRRIWQDYEQRIRSEPLKAHEIGVEFLSAAEAIDVFQDNFNNTPNRLWYAKSWVLNAEFYAERTPAAIRQRKTTAQRKRRAAQRTVISEEVALARVLEHCEVVSEGRLATPLGQLRRGLLGAGLDRRVLLAAGISTKTRRQHRPSRGGASFYYATILVDGKRVPIRLVVVEKSVVQKCPERIEERV